MAAARLLSGDVWCIRMNVVLRMDVDSIYIILCGSSSVENDRQLATRRSFGHLLAPRQNVIVHVVNSVQLETLKCRTRTTQFL